MIDFSFKILHFDAVFLEGTSNNFCTTFDSLHIFFKRRASYRFKGYEFRNLQAFEFFLIVDEISFKSNLEFRNVKISKLSLLNQ